MSTRQGTTAPDPAAVAAHLRAVLASIAVGELTASAVTTQRLEGALVAFQLMASGEPGDIVEWIANPDEAKPPRPAL